MFTTKVVIAERGIKNQGFQKIESCLYLKSIAQFGVSWIYLAQKTDFICPFFPIPFCYLKPIK